MSYTVRIASNTNNETEWVEVFEAHTRKVARRKATNWLRANVFQADYTELEKRTVGNADYWTLWTN